MSFAWDLHVHTRTGSADSRIAAHEVRDSAGLQGIVLAEHERRWPTGDLELHGGGGPSLVSARECETPYGHIVVIGVADEALAAIRSVEELRLVVDARHGAMILAHPFRHFPSSWNLLFPQSQDHWGAVALAEWPPERLAEHPVFGLVDAIEVLNSGCTPAQNALAEGVANVRRLPRIGASDAHDRSFIGYFATAFEATIRGDQDLVAALRSGLGEPVVRAADGTFEPADAVFLEGATSARRRR